MLYIPNAPDPQGMVKVRDSGIRYANPDADREVDLPLGMVLANPVGRAWIGQSDPGYLLGGVYRGKFYDMATLDQMFLDMGPIDRYNFMSFLSAPRVSAFWLPQGRADVGPGYATALVTHNFGPAPLPNAFSRIAAGCLFAVNSLMRVEIWFDITSPVDEALTLSIAIVQPISGILVPLNVSVVASPGAHKVEFAFTMRPVVGNDAGDVILLSTTLDGVVTVNNSSLAVWPDKFNPPYAQVFDVSFVDAPTFLTLTGVIHATGVHIAQ